MNKPKQDPGTDYSGPGATCNRDSATGIRYGIISCNDVSSDALDTIYSNGDDLDYEDYVQAVRDILKKAIEDFIEEKSHNEKAMYRILRDSLSSDFSDHKWSDEKPSKLDRVVSSIVEDIYPGWHDEDTNVLVVNAFNAIQDDINDGYQGNQNGCTQMEWEGEGYKLHTDAYGDLWIFKSDYYTYAQFCSPCAPGAVHLGSPLDIEGTLALSVEIKEKFHQNRGYCLDHDWFEGGIAPYPVFSVATGKQCIVRKVNVVCPNCNGTGRDTIKRLAEARDAREELIKRGIESKEIPVENADMETGTFDCVRCSTKGTLETVEIEEV